MQTQTSKKNKIKQKKFEFYLFSNEIKKKTTQKSKEKE